LPRRIELEARDPLAVGQYGRLGQLSQLAAVHERFQDVLLGLVIVVNDLGHPLAEWRQVLDVLVDSIVSDIVGSGLGSQQPVVADVLLGEAVPVVTANNRVGKIEIFDHGLQLALVLPGTFRPKIMVIFFGCPIVRFISSKR